METTKMTYINWINAKVAKPSNDGTYLVFSSYKSFFECKYSADRGLFYFESSPETGIDVFWWTIKPELPYKEDENEA